MKVKFMLFALLAVVLVGCKNQQAKPAEAEAETPEFVVVTPNNLVDNISEYLDAKVELEGLVSHVCQTGKKMKMTADNGTVITVFPKDTLEVYDASLARKIVKVYGVAGTMVVDSDHVCEHDLEAAAACEDEQAEVAKAPAIIVTCEKYEIVKDVDEE